MDNVESNTPSPLPLSSPKNLPEFSYYEFGLVNIKNVF